ncbi:monovalent cation/H+ antiporter subunit D family protein [Nocardioides sp.]|uniref:monovalent cation/H+ antiporter subunit D family protein n=1 Tax=Nocardioides sp. TaxID=35761 RepID=UPI0027340F1C|nr:monovalent cation/H+ antiporter subunit D family protein [Nocardioides sp.]MDP3892785.1 monovalent cation/H+ antiporter subunit D family protein [Nocardioides sp.]
MTAPMLPLLVVLPLVAAAIGALLPGRLARPLLVISPVLTTAGGISLLFVHGGTPVLAHHVGGFVPGIAIPFVSDTFTAVMITVTGVTTLACSVFALMSGEARLRFFPTLVLMLAAGVNGALLTGDLFNLFVFIEVMLLPSYALIAMTGTWRRLGIGRLFVVLNLVTSTIFLIGVGLVYGVAGSVNMSVLSTADADDPRFLLAVTVVLLALSVKAGVVPLHGWLPRAYPATSASVMALFSALHTKVAIYAIYRIHQVVLDGAPAWATLVLVLVTATMVVGAYGSLGERMIRRSLAWQMVAGVGYILAGLGIGTQLGIAAGLFYMTHHILVMGALLLAAGAIEHAYRTHQFVGLSGLMRREPVLAVIMALGMMSLVGFPPSSGFFAKVGLVRAAAELDGARLWLVLGAVLVASIGTLLAMMHLWSEVFWGPPLEEMPSRGQGPAKDPEIPAGTTMPRRTIWPAGALLVASLTIFVLPGPVWELCVQAAESLQDVAAYAEAVTRP